MIFKIEYTLTTMSGCLIGNQTQSFSVGGVDQATTVDETGYPMIPGSAMKGALRAMLIEEREECSVITEYYQSYFNKLEEKYERLESKVKQNLDHELFEKYKKEISPSYIFGLSGWNQMPKLYFSDVRMSEEEKKERKPEDCLLIDTKTAILEEADGQVSSNPRTYQVVRPGTRMDGEIFFKGANSADENKIRKMMDKMKDLLLEFETGFYLIGNSKSRGYGRVKVELRSEGFKK